MVGLAGSAQAATVKVCAEYQVDYEDSDLPNYDDAYHGDYFYSNSDKVARGARIRMERVSDGSFQDQFADWEGSDAGCATFTLNEGVAFHVRLVSEAQVNGNTIRVRNDGTNNALSMSTLASNVTFSSGSSTVTYASPTHAVWNVAAAAGHAMWRRHGGLSNKVFDLYWNDNSPCNGGSCHRDGDVWLSSAGRESRFIIVHEIGHAIEYFVSDGGAVTDYESNKGDCFTDSSESHEMQSKEWQSAAIKEGWAQFYAAVAFNQTRYNECGFVYYKDQDYGLDTQVEGDGFHAITCEAGPGNLPNLSPAVDNFDYLGDFCSGTLTDRATELDWTRFWWDLTSDEAVSFTDCAEILADAITGDIPNLPPLGAWDPSPDSSTPSTERPGLRMETSANQNGFATEWASWNVPNGIHR